jgi:iron-sulfur cluster repair protein YtfE (RIC family)
MNAIDLLIKQHEETKDALEKAQEGELEAAELKLMADELVAHMVIEEHVFYPRIRELDKDLVKESFEEHAVARFELARALIAEGEEQEVRLGVLKELIEHHIEEEEKELFPKVRRGIPEAELTKLGEKMELMFDKAVEAGLEKLVVGTADLKKSPDPAAQRRSGTMRRGNQVNGRARTASR